MFISDLNMETIHEVCEESSQRGDEDDNPAAASSLDFAFTGKRSSYREQGGGLNNRSYMCSRCKAMGSVQLVKIHGHKRELELHKCPLVSRSGYLTRVFRNSSQFSLPFDFPGGLDAFDAVVSFCLGGSSLVLDPSNIATLRCAAEYLEMNEEIGPPGNLCEKTELYLNQVALRSWADAILVLRSCESLLPLAEELFIVSRCVDALASMARSELQQQRPLFFDGRLGRERPWKNAAAGGKVAKAGIGSSSWMKELLRFPFTIFSRMIISCRKQGLAEKHVSHLVVKYVEKWLFSETCLDYDYDGDGDGDDETHQNSQDLSEEQLLEMLECIVRLLPFERGAVPINFLFALLRYAIAIDAGTDCRIQLETRIASQLDFATIDDFLMPFKSARETPTLVSELDSMKHIVALFMSQYRSLDSDSALANWEAVASVAKVWDEYLAEIGYSSSISALKFAELIDAVPSFLRVSHDQLYKAIHIFLKAHPSSSQQERVAICRSLDCQKLSQEVCIHVVQNELMPMRTIVQAMLVQQLHTKSAMNHSFRMNNNAFPDRDLNWQQQQQNSAHYEASFRSPYDNAGCDELPFLMNSGHTSERGNQACGLKADLEATNSKLESLEKQLIFIRRTLTGTHCSSASSSGGDSAAPTTTTSGLCDGSRGKRSSSNNNNPSGVGRRLSKALQKMGLISGLCKGNPEGHGVLNPERCLPMTSSVHPETDRLIGNDQQQQHPLVENDTIAPPRRSTSREDGGSQRLLTTKHHSRRYSIS